MCNVDSAINLYQMLMLWFSYKFLLGVLGLKILRSHHVDAHAVYRTIRFPHYKDNANIFEINYIHFI